MWNIVNQTDILLCLYRPARGAAERGVCAKPLLAAAEAAGGRSSV